MSWVALAIAIAALGVALWSAWNARVARDELHYARSKGPRVYG